MHIMESANIRSARDFRPDDEVVPGVLFGSPEWVPTPAFWAAMADRASDELDDYVSPAGTPLAEDVAFCLLGGTALKWGSIRPLGKNLGQPADLRPQLRP